MHHTPTPIHRRTVLLAAALAGSGWAVPAAHALPLKTLVFPRDRGAHPDFRTEWWYITGQALAGDRLFGFQLTFFRSRIDATQGMASQFAAKQLLFAHAAISDVAGNKLHHDQRIARSGFDVANASDADMAIKLRDWSLTAKGSGYTAQLPTADFGLDLQFTETQAVLLQGKQVFEIKPGTISKGRAVDDFMLVAPFAGRTPVFVGDDVTDEAGLLAAQALGGVGVKVGDGPTAAAYRVPSPGAVRAWLQRCSDAFTPETPKP